MDRKQWSMSLTINKADHDTDTTSNDFRSIPLPENWCRMRKPLDCEPSAEPSVEAIQ